MYFVDCRAVAAPPVLRREPICAAKSWRLHVGCPPALSLGVITHFASAKRSKPRRKLGHTPPRSEGCVQWAFQREARAHRERPKIRESHKREQRLSTVPFVTLWLRSHRRKHAGLQAPLQPRFPHAARRRDAGNAGICSDTLARAFPSGHRTACDAGDHFRLLRPHNPTPVCSRPFGMMTAANTRSAGQSISRRRRSCISPRSSRRRLRASRCRSRSTPSTPAPVVPLKASTSRRALRPFS